MWRIQDVVFLVIMVIAIWLGNICRDKKERE